MNYKGYIKTLENQISFQSFENQLKFAVLISQKLYFDYQRFYEVYKWGDSGLLIDAIMVCQKAVDNQLDINHIKALIPKIDLIIPDMDEFGSVLSSYALNASAAVYETLQFIIDRDGSHIFNIATYYTDTIDFKIQEEKDLTEEEIEKNLVMIEAWNFVLEETKPTIE